MAKLTTSQVAKILGVHPDTVRKRARAGKIPFTLDVNGHMSFDESDLQVKTCTPQSCVSAVKDQLTKVIFVIDKSGSMRGHENKMRQLILDQLDSFKKASTASNRYLFSTILFNGVTGKMTPFLDVSLGSISPFTAGGSTALYATMESTGIFVDHDMRSAADNTAYLVVLFTDGGNTDYPSSPDGVATIVNRLAKTDRVTFAVNCPAGMESSIVGMGIPSGNVQAWNQTNEGFVRSTALNTSAIQSYTQSRGAGQTVSMSYYAQVNGSADQVAQQLAGNLNDVTKQVNVQRVTKNDAIAIRTFAEKKFGNFEKGSLFYELTKTEKVQSYKRIIVQDKKTGQFFHGWDAARQLLNLPAFSGEIKVAPGKLGDFAVFVQSTSYNRKLVPGTAVVKLT